MPQILSSIFKDAFDQKVKPNKFAVSKKDMISMFM